MQDIALHSLPRQAVTLPAEAPEFDAWLRGHLAHLHSAVLAEPVPDRFLRLLDGLPQG